jgi:hypothetical protein
VKKVDKLSIDDQELPNPFEHKLQIPEGPPPPGVLQTPMISSVVSSMTFIIGF